MNLPLIKNRKLLDYNLFYVEYIFFKRANIYVFNKKSLSRQLGKSEIVCMLCAFILLIVFFSLPLARNPCSCKSIKCSCLRFFRRLLILALLVLVTPLAKSSNALAGYYCVWSLSYFLI
jgi:hypothetical protein